MKTPASFTEEPLRHISEKQLKAAVESFISNVGLYDIRRLPNVITESLVPREAISIEQLEAYFAHSQDPEDDALKPAQGVKVIWLGSNRVDYFSETQLKAGLLDTIGHVEKNIRIFWRKTRII